MVENIPTKPAIKPILSQAEQSNAAGGVLTSLTIVGPTGIPQTMNANQARKLVSKHPNDYQIID